jgi:hypothetical protein
MIDVCDRNMLGRRILFLKQKRRRRSGRAARRTAEASLAIALC